MEREAQIDLICHHHHIITFIIIVTILATEARAIILIHQATLCELYLSQISHSTMGKH